MAASIGVRELRQYASTYLARVKEGESLVVTERGRPIARLVPIGEGTDDWRRAWIETGRMVDAAPGPSFRWTRAPHLPLPADAASWSALLEEQRADRR